MKTSIEKQIQEVNAALGALLSTAREALAGRKDFTSEDIKAISEPLGQMTPIVSRASELRAVASDADLKTYTRTLEELQITLEQVRFMLLARRTHLEISRSHLNTFNLWAKTFEQTR